MKDTLAMACSGLCLCHCLLTPVLLTVGSLGMVAGFLQSEALHQILLLPVVCLAVASLPFSFRLHLRWPPLLLAGVGGLFLLASFTAPESFEVALTVPAGLLLIGAHLLNRRFLRSLGQQR